MDFASFWGREMDKVGHWSSFPALIFQSLLKQTRKRFTCLRNFIQVQVMGAVPTTLANSSTDSPARTFLSSGN